MMSEQPGSELITVSLFSGGGGLDLGLEAVGFSVVFATDIDEHSCTTLRWGKKRTRDKGKSFLQDAVIYRDNIKKISAGLVERATGYTPGEIDLLAGGPPCQAFSVFGRRRGLEDERGLLAFEYLRLIRELRPQAFLFENVYGILTVGDGEVMEEIRTQFSDPGDDLHYELSELRLDAVDYAVPQFRDRVFVVGHLGGKKFHDHDVRKITVEDPLREAPSLPGMPEACPWRTVRDALRGLPDMGAPLSPANHVGRNHSQRIIDRYAGLEPGERDPRTRINKLDLERPSFTIVVGSDSGGGKGHIHPIEPREVTPRESARIQTFPDWWEFSGTSRHPIRQVGNAVPPLLAAALGNEIRTRLFELDRIPFDDYLSLLDQQHLFKEE